LQSLQGQQEQMKNQQLGQEMAGQQALAKYVQDNPDASFEDITRQGFANQALAPSTLGTVLWRSGGAESKNMGSMLKAPSDLYRSGVPLDMAMTSAGLNPKLLTDAGYDPQEFTNKLAQSLAAQRTAKAGQLEQEGNLQGAKAAQISALTPELVKNAQARR